MFSRSSYAVSSFYRRFSTQGRLVSPRKLYVLLLVAALTAAGMLRSRAQTAGPVFNPANGHHYELVTSSLDWASARDAAATRSFLGKKGHLATVTTQAESDFLAKCFPSIGAFIQFWLGGFQSSKTDEPSGNWQWVTGESFSFTNWSSFQPDNAGDTEDYLELNPNADGHWNDNTSVPRPYIVEYDTPGLSVGDAKVTEGASGTTTTLTFPVKLSGTPSSTVTVNYAIADYTAKLGSDYTLLTPSPGTLTFAAGTTTLTQNVSVTVTGDATVEPTEVLLLNLTSSTNAGIMDGQGVGTIVTDDFGARGGKIAFASNSSGNYEIYVMNADGSNRSRLTNNNSPDGDPNLSRDGSKIVFASDRDGNREIYVINADGSGEKRLTNNSAHDSNPMFSPDGRIAFFSDRNGNWDIILMNADGSGQTSITTQSSSDVNPSFSVDGSRILFNSDVSGSYEIYNIGVDDNGQQRLTNNSFVDAGPRCSPSGGKIIFQTLRNGPENYDIYSINNDGSGESPLVTNSTADIGAAYSPDGSKIVFQSNRGSDGNNEIFVANADGSGQTRLTTQSGLDHDVSPSWAPGTVSTLSISPPTQITEGSSGSASATFTVTLSPPNEQEVKVDFATANGTAFAPGDYLEKHNTLTFAPGVTTQTINVSIVGDTIYEPTEKFKVNLSNARNAFIQNGQAVGVITDTDSAGVRGGKIVFNSNRDGNSEIYVMNADGSNQTRLTVNNSADFGPTFNADGTKIVFSSDRPGPNNETLGVELYSMNADGSNPTRLTFTQPTEADVEPNFSPDGKRIVFASTRGNTGGFYDLYIMNADGSAQTKLTPDTEPVDRHERKPAFSPDGTKIAFERRISGVSNIYEMDDDGTDWRQITTGDSDYYPVYSADGGKLIFGFDSAVRQIMKVDLNGDNRGLLSTANNHVQPDISPDGNRLVFCVAGIGNNDDIWTMSIEGEAAGGLVKLTSDDTWSEGSPSWAPGFVPPTVSISDAKVPEGASNTTNDAVFTVTLSSDATQSITVPYGIAMKNGVPVGTATAGTDYLAPAAGASITIPAGQRTGTIKVTVKGDATVEPTEYFAVALSSSASYSLLDGEGIGIIVTDDVGAKGGKIVFVSQRDGNREIYIMNADGTNQTRLTNNPAEDTDPCLSPDGSKIAFVSDRPGGNGQVVYIMNADGTNLKQLVAVTTPEVDVEPSFSPDGSKIVFGSSRDGNSYQLDLYVMNSDGSGQTKLSSAADAGDLAERHPVFSPDGRKIAYEKFVSPNSNIYEMDADGNNSRQVTFGDKDVAPTYNADGSKLLFETYNGVTRHVMEIKLDGSGLNPLTTTGDNRYPDMSPDGSKIVFGSTRVDSDEDIWTMTSAGEAAGSLTNLTPNSNERDFEPSWGPGNVTAPNPLIVTTTSESISNDAFTSLREAITYANAHPGSTITFKIPATDPNNKNGVCTIMPASQLPDITGDGIVIDGSSQTGFNTTTRQPLIVINGQALSTVAACGLTVKASRCAIKSLIINGFSKITGDNLDQRSYGILISGAVANENTIQGCYIGIDNTGTLPLGNDIGISLQNNSGGNTIGGSTPDARNVISGNNTAILEWLAHGANRIVGNYVGVDRTGGKLVADKNGIAIILYGTTEGSVIGGVNAGERNIISGDAHRIQLLSNNNIVQGNYIGTDASGTINLHSGGTGILVQSGASQNTIGGTTAGAGNLICGNGESGIVIGDGASSGNKVLGNLIGTNSSGASGLGNKGDGIVLRAGAISNTIGGSTAAERNIISGNTAVGVRLSGSTTKNNSVLGNFIGVDPTGAKLIPNANGIAIDNGASSNTIGGAQIGAGNCIGGNTQSGIALSGTATSNAILGNFIGINPAGTAPLPNGTGVSILQGAKKNIIGGTGANAGNRIAFNIGDGILVKDSTSIGNQLRGNGIYQNGSGPTGGIGINLQGINETADHHPTTNDLLDTDTGPNNLQNFPVIKSIRSVNGMTTVTATLNSLANTGFDNLSFDVDVYTSLGNDPSGFGEGQVYRATKSSVTTDGNGNSADFSVDIPGTFTGQYFALTATNNNTGDTSEFSSTAQAGPPNDFIVNSQKLLADSGTLPGTNTNLGATAETNEAAHANIPANHSVWYSWTPNATGSASIDTQGSKFDTVLAVYTLKSGASLDVGNLVAVENGEDDDRLFPQSKVIFNAVAGTTYYIVVDGSNSSSQTGDLILNWSISTGVRPATIEWANAVSGNWNDTTKWVDTGTGLHRIPTNDDVVAINVEGTYEVTVDNISVPTIAGLVLGAASDTTQQFLNLNGRTLTLNGPSAVNKTGVLRVTPGSTLIDNTDMAVAGQLSWSGGTLSGTGNLNIETGGSLAISGDTDVTKLLSQLHLDNAGSANWQGTGNILVRNGATISNTGTWTIQTDASFVWDTPTSGIKPQFSNSGKVLKSLAPAGPLRYDKAGRVLPRAGSGTTSFSGMRFSNLGGSGVDMQSGTLNLKGGGENYGTVHTAAGTQVQFNSSYVVDKKRSIFSGAGTTSVLSNSSFIVNVPIEVGKPDVPEELGAFNLDTSGFVVGNGVVITNSGVLTGQNNSKMTKAGSTATFTLKNSSKAQLRGTPYIEGDVDNSGVVDPTDMPGLPAPQAIKSRLSLPSGTGGIINVNGNFNQTSTGVLNIRLSGLNSYGRIVVGGNVVLAGNLQASASFVPGTGQTFEIIRAKTISGNFANVTNAAGILDLGNGLKVTATVQHGLTDAATGQKYDGYVLAATNNGPRLNSPSLTPTSGVVGTTLTLTGSNLLGSNNKPPVVKFNNGTVPATTTVSSSPTSVSVKVPPGAVTGAVTVTTDVGTATTTGTTTPTFTVLPSITNYTNTAGAVISGGGIGSTVVINGDGFLPGPAIVIFKTATATVAVNVASPTATRLSVIVPSTAVTGALVVKTAAGSATGGTFTVVAKPTITGFTPTSGSVGMSITINGTNFTNTTTTKPTVKFGATLVAAASVTVVSASQIKALVPTGSTTGKITVTTSGGDALSAATFTVVPQPVISSFTPTSGSVGMSITINGTNFTNATTTKPTVKFGATVAAAASVTVVSASQIKAVVPSGATTGKITVTTTGGDAVSASNFTVVPKPTITSFTPTSGSVGMSITINGTNFTNATTTKPTVKFGATVATTVTVVSSSQVKAVVPLGAVTGLVSVTTTGGTVSSTTNFTVVPKPAINSFTPLSGSVGTEVTINGTALTNATTTKPTVKFGAVTAATVTVVSSSQVKTLVPANAVTGLLSVTTTGGSITSTTNFTVVAKPSIANFTPTSGSVGMTVTINGAALTNATTAKPTVKFNSGAATTVTVVSSSQVTAVVPSGAISGLITVTTTGGTATSTSNFNVVPKPTLNAQTSTPPGLSPDRGKVGSTVTLCGTNLTNATTPKPTVLFNSTPGTVVSVSPTKVLVTVPTLAAGASYTIKLTTTGGTVSPAVSFTVTSTGLMSDGDSSSGAVNLSPVRLSSAWTKGAVLVLSFSGALDAGSATELGHYSVQVNGLPVEIESLSYVAASHSVVIGLPSGSFRKGDTLTVQWSNIQDANRLTVSGSTDITAR